MTLTNLPQEPPHPHYLLAEDDTAFLKRPELRPVRFQLELLKPEMILEEQGIASTLVVFGGTSIVEHSVAEQRLSAARQALASDPTSAVNQRAVLRAERILAKSHFYDEAREFARIVSSSCHRRIAPSSSTSQVATRFLFVAGSRSMDNCWRSMRMCLKPSGAPT